MGFQEKQAKVKTFRVLKLQEALMKAGWDEEQALNYLLSAQTRINQVQKLYDHLYERSN